MNPSSTPLAQSLPSSPGAEDEMDALRNAVIVVTGQWEVTRWNHAAAELFGVCRDDVLGRDLWASTPALARSTAAAAAIRHAACERRPWTGSLALSPADDAPTLTALRPFGDSLLLIEVERGAPLGALSLTESQVARLDALLARALGGRTESEALAGVARGLAGAGMNLTEALTFLATRTCALLDAQGAAVTLAEGDELAVHAAAGGVLADAPGTRAPLHPSLAGIAVGERRVVISNSARTDPRVAALFARAYDVEQVAVAPMIVEDIVVGTLTVLDSARGEFTPADGALLQRLADHGALAVRNGRLFARAEQAARAAQALSEIARQISGSLELDRVVGLIARHATELLGARGARLGMLDGDEIVKVASYGVGLADTSADMSADGDAPAAAPELELRAPLAGSFTGECIRTGRPVRTGNLSGEGQRWPWSAAHTATAERHAVAAPLLAGGQAIGAIMVLGSARPFDEEDERLLAALADHAAVAIENARLFRTSERMRSHADLLAAAVRGLAVNVTPSATYADITRIARTSLGADGVAIYLADPATERVELPHSEGAGASVTGMILRSFWPTAGGAAVTSGVPEFRADIRAFSSEPVMRALTDCGVASVAMLPLLVEGRPRGLLALRFATRQRFDAEGRRLLVDFSAHVALAMRNALLFADLERRAARLAAVATVQQAISAARSLEQVYAELYSAVASVVDAPGFALLELDAETQSLTPEYVVIDGHRVATGGLPSQPVAGCGEMEEALRGGETTVVAQPRAAWEAHARLVAGGAGVGAGIAGAAVALTAPIVHGERVLGVLQAVSYRLGAYDRDDADLITLIARQAGSAITSARDQARQRMLATALETMEQPVLVCEPGGGIRYANGAAAREYGYGPEELAGMHVSRLRASRTTEAAGEIAATLERGSAWSGERLYQRKDGSEFPAWTTIGPIVADDGRLIGAVGSIRNLTDERRVADQLRQSERMAALGELVAGVAHEVNNPLTGISAFAQILAAEPLTDDQIESVRLIKREADRAVAVIRNLLAFARKSGPRSVLVNLNELVDQTLRLRAYGLRTAGIGVEPSLDRALRPIRGDDRQLQQVLLNLVVNAEHAMVTVGRRVLSVRTWNEGERVMLEVGDTGIGMSPEIAARIFEPFYTTKPEGAGTGLGLSVSYGIVQAHGGTLTVRSAPGAGACFRITLPASLVSAASPTIAPSAATSPVGSSEWR
ncbi:MAG: GAF domain-containing protein [Gemmatimonadaceae bacterium]